MSHNERQNRVLMIGGAIWTLSFAVRGVNRVVTDNGYTHQTLNGWDSLVEALLQTIGAMVVAATDADLDLFAKKHPRSVVVFALTWNVLFVGFYALTPPIFATNQVFWLAALPFASLLLCFTPVLQMRDERYPRFSDLLAYSLALELGSWGVYHFLYAHTITGPTWPEDIVGIVYVVGGVLVFGIYWYFRGTHSHRMALPMTLYAYLLLFGFGDLASNLVQQHAYDEPDALIDYSFAIIHITFPLAYFALQTFIHRFIGRRWLIQRRDATQFRLMQVLETRGNLVEVETAITVNADLNAFVFFTKEDELTLLHLAVLNEHHDSVQRLLQTGEVQANKASGSKGCTALFLAAELGRVHAAVLLLEHAADVNMLADDDQSPLIVATANGHLKVAKLLRDNGANEDHKWMRLNGACFITFCRTL